MGNGEGIKVVTMKSKALGLTFAILMLIVLAACGSDNTNSGGTSAPASSTATASPSQQADSGNGETRIVKDEFGEVEIPAHPQRVMGIYVEDYLKALEVTPIAQWYHPSWGKQDYLNLDVPLFDTTGSIEALLSYDPDLIIVDGSVDKGKYAVYSKIAPTYRLPESVLQSSRDVLKVIADLLNMPEKAKRSKFKVKATFL